MAIPVQFQQFKSAGIYRVVYDKSTVLGTEAELLRLVVGYSPKGPFNTPVYIKSVSDFKAMYGDISKSLEKRGIFFHRTCIHALEAGPIICLNLKKFSDEKVGAVKFGDTVDTGEVDVKTIYDTSRFWKLEPDNLVKDDDENYLVIAAADSIETSNTVFVRKALAADVKGYNISIGDWYKSMNIELPDYLVGKESDILADYFIDVFVFKGSFTADQLAASPSLKQYFTITYTANDDATALVLVGDKYYNASDVIDGEAKEGATPVSDYVKIGEQAYLPKDVTASDVTVVRSFTNAFGDDIDGLDALYANVDSGAINRYIGCVLPDFYDPNYGYKAIDILFNSDSDSHRMMMGINEKLLDNVDYDVTAASMFYVVDDAGYKPYYLKGYEFVGAPKSTVLEEKAKWISELLSTMISEAGLRDALLSTAEIDYRYIVDSFESIYLFNTPIKDTLSLIAKSKELCFAILNFPSVNSLCKSAIGKFTNDSGVFDVKTVVDEYNGVVLPSEANGASFCAFYTPVKFSDGYVDTIVPSAGLVSNLFMSKYNGRAAYNIVAGPNYGKLNYYQLVGPEYNFSQAELHVIEPYGVNCLVYRPTFGTFINANQTAKQTPKSALSSINVRELVIYLQDEIGKILQAYQWEFNNSTTREAIKAKADLICETAKADGGIQAYLNVMDESNNTADIADNEMCVISTAIEPGRGMGKMIHELTIYRTGGMSAIIKE